MKKEVRTVSSSRKERLKKYTEGKQRKKYDFYEFNIYTTGSKTSKQDNLQLKTKLIEQPESVYREFIPHGMG